MERVKQGKGEAEDVRAAPLCDRCMPPTGGALLPGRAASANQHRTMISASGARLVA
jgi:hypothetical protein